MLYSPSWILRAEFSTHSLFFFFPFLPPPSLRWKKQKEQNQLVVVICNTQTWRYKNNLTCPGHLFNILWIIGVIKEPSAKLARLLIYIRCRPNSCTWFGSLVTLEEPRGLYTISFCVFPLYYNFTYKSIHIYPVCFSLITARSHDKMG